MDKLIKLKDELIGRLICCLAPKMRILITDLYNQLIKLQQEYIDLEEYTSNLEKDAKALRELLFAASEILANSADQVDEIFPNDANPEMQDTLRSVSNKCKQLSTSELGSIRAPDDMLAKAAEEERGKHQDARRELDNLKKQTVVVLAPLRGLMLESRGVDGYHLNGAVASWGELGYPGEIDDLLKVVDS